MIQDNPAEWSAEDGVRSAPWGEAFRGTEHPETARIRVQQAHVETMVALKREAMDKVYGYLTMLVERGKEELQHARGSNAEHRRVALRSQVDEILAYLKGQAIEVAPPATSHGDGGYALDEIPAFFGRVRCTLDQWFDSHLIAVYDEMLTLVSPKRRGAAPEQ